MTVAERTPAPVKSPVRRISISGVGQIAAAPDMAEVSASVVTKRKTSAEALVQNSATMRTVIAGLKADGIEAKDIQTTTFGIEPIHAWTEGKRRELEGYEATNSIEVDVRDLKRLGPVIDKMIALGVNHINGVNFDHAQKDELLDEARLAAMQNARHRAELLAKATGAKLGAAIIVEEITRDFPRRSFQDDVTMLAIGGRIGDSVPFEAGTDMVQVKVHVTWELLA